MEKKIPVAFISDDNYILPTCVAITSLVMNKKPDTVYDIIIIMAECSEESEKRILMLPDLGCPVRLIKASLDKYSEIKQLAHISRAGLLKFDLCDMVPEYDKIIYLDGDLIIRKDLSELYHTDLKGCYAAAVKEQDCMLNDRGNINSGVVLFNAERIRKEHLREVFLETRLSLGDRRSMDQQTFNLVMGKEYRYLPIKYNCVLGKLTGQQKEPAYTVERINALYQTEYQSVDEVINDAIIVHFATSDKPWLYTFNPGAKEWYRYYLNSPYKDVPFVLRGKWSYRANKMKEAWEKEGFKGVWGRIEDKIKRVFVKTKMDAWE